MNNPLRYTDPTGHMVACNPMEDDCHDPDPAPSPALGGGGGNNHNDPTDDEDDPNPNGLAGLPPNPLTTQPFTPPYTPPCQLILAVSACQNISGLLSIGALTLDSISAIGSSIFAGLMIVALLGGPIGVTAVEGAYMIANIAEGWAGAASFLLTAANDFLVTGGSYITLGSKPEVVLSSDFVISGIFAGAGGADPEPFGDTLMNGAGASYDLYRLEGHDVLFRLHMGPSGWYLTDH